MICLSLVMTSSAFAAGYGAAGCGLGSIVLGDQKGFMQVFAATTNGTSGSQTFGISSGTSNCGSGGKTPTQFIEANKSALNNDIARGEGDTLAALSEIYGCSEAASLNNVLKTNYKQIFKAEKANEINTNIINVIKANNISCNELV